MHSKRTLLKDIAALENSVKMEAIIWETLAKFKHYKQVNKRFIDALKEQGLNAWITKDDYSTTLNITGNNTLDFGFRLYISHCMTKRELTWDDIESSLKVRHDFKGQLEKRKEMLELFEKEFVIVEGLVNQIKELDKLTCFSLYGGLREIEKLVDFVKYDRAA